MVFEELKVEMAPQVRLHLKEIPWLTYFDLGKFVTKPCGGTRPHILRASWQHLRQLKQCKRKAFHGETRTRLGHRDAGAVSNRPKIAFHALCGCITANRFNQELPP